MLFDLRGRRRRVVQATYLMLALLLGGGLVLFGIGGDVSGGLADIFKDGGNGDDGNSQLEQRIDRQQERLKASPENAAVLAELVRLNYQVASSQIAEGGSAFPAAAKDELRRTGAYWERYVDATEGEPSPSLARLALQAYAPEGLNQPDKAKEAVRIIAADANDTQTYLLLVQYATTASDTRLADLAGQKAVDLAPKNLRKQVEKQVEQLKKPPASQQTPDG
jgi:hypothetical protein